MNLLKGTTGQGEKSKGTDAEDRGGEVTPARAAHGGPDRHRRRLRTQAR